jgi:hypothetical protein
MELVNITQLHLPVWMINSRTTKWSFMTLLYLRIYEELFSYLEAEMDVGHHIH